VSEHFRNGVQPEVIWDCVDLGHFRYDESRFREVAARYQLPDKDHHLTVLTLGRLSVDAAYKGYSRLIDVFAKVHQQYPQVRLIIGGKGNLVPALTEQVRKSGLAQSVIFTGSVAEGDLPVLYAYADVFSMVTESGDGKGEGIPLTPLEAMACRTPIIVGNQDGSREAVFDGANGYVIDPFDLKEHERVIIELIADREKRERMSLAAEHVARTHFSYAGFREKHMIFYQRPTAK
jgi:phosphatidylinositol alpha-1,6-mannosyltransferase